MLPQCSSKNNLSLIGMPSCGKSTLGKYVAAQGQLDFIDTDRLIEKHVGMPLQAIVDQQGWQALREIEASVINSISCQHHVISTGGSAVYSSAAMSHLRAVGELVFLDISLSEMIKRLGDTSTRGLAKPENQSLEAMYHERRHLYQKSCTLQIRCDAKSLEEIGEQLLSLRNR